MMQKPIEITCAHCRRIFIQEATWKNHQKTCKGQEVDGKRFKCGVCGLWRNKANRARNMRTHNNTPVHQNTPTPAKTYRNKTNQCQNCQRILSATNMARHMRTCQ